MLRFYLQFSTQISWNQLRYKQRVFSLDNRGTAVRWCSPFKVFDTIHPSNYGQIHKYKSPFRVKKKEECISWFQCLLLPWGLRKQAGYQRQTGQKKSALKAELQSSSLWVPVLHTCHKPATIGRAPPPNPWTCQSFVVLHRESGRSVLNPE